MRRVLNIAVLECDTPVEPVRERYGSYGDFFQRLLEVGMKQITGDSQADVRVAKWNVVAEQKYPDPEQVDGILMSGSKFNSFDDTPWILSLVDYIRKVLTEHSTKVVGICFGHQIIARAMGARVGRSGVGWELSCTKFDLTEEGSRIFTKSSLSLHQMHQDIVFELPEGFTNLGSTKKCPIQGLYKPGRVLSLQAHPEYNGDIISKIIDVRHGMGIFDDATWQEALSRAELPYDELVSSEAICKFWIDG